MQTKTHFLSSMCGSGGERSVGQRSTIEEMENELVFMCKIQHSEYNNDVLSHAGNWQSISGMVLS